MLAGVDPRLNRIEALADPGCYSLTFELDGGGEQSVVARMRGPVAVLPVNAFAGWAAGSPSFQAVAAVVQNLDAARELAAPSGPRLVDLDGGWDVGLGNVILRDGQPACVSHGPLELLEQTRYRCVVCGARAGYPG
jgi:hypothetical protein